MATSGKKFRKRNYITLEAPVLYVDKSPVWMDRHWPAKFFSWLREEKMVFTEIKMNKDRLTLYFNTAKECTMFGLKYDREKQKEIFRTSEWS